ncbi:MAG: mechanosensitive ion channel [Ktedonobacterales bacterium]|nr:mechanosensitive ion channel [Ktedonobacterales bacterium]
MPHHFPGFINATTLPIGIALGAVLLCWVARAPVRWLLVRGISWLALRLRRDHALVPEEVRARVAQVVAVPMNYLAVFIGLEVAQNAIANQPLAELLLKVNFTLITVTVGMVLGKFINQLLLNSNRRFNLLGITVEPQLLPFVHTFVWAFIIFVVLVNNLRKWGIDPTALIAGTGLAGLAISLAAKDTADNLLGYFIIVMERPFLIGDAITASSVSGTVEHIGWRSTRLRQPDQVLVTVPNKNLTSANIANSKRLTKHLLETHLRLAYDTTPEAITELLAALRDMLAARPLVEAESVGVRLAHLDADALDIAITCNILDPDVRIFMEEQERIALALLGALHAAGFRIAAPGQLMFVQTVAAPSANGHLLSEEPVR